jgi:tryptophan synthase alpha chain
VKSLETTLRATRASGTKALVPYFVAGATPEWISHVEAAVAAGATAVEIGIPFSDPMMDGPAIQEAAGRALERGTTLDSVCTDLARLDVGVPLIAMTYYNLFLHYGPDRAARRLQSAGISGAIVPDLPVEEATTWRAACDQFDIANIFLVAPSTPPVRVAKITNVGEGFVYAQARMAVTGASDNQGDAARVVAAIRSATDLPVYVGIGVTTPQQAAEAAGVADGVIVGSAVVQLTLKGANPREIEDFVATFRQVLDHH